jgi:hypothetical protein
MIIEPPSDELRSALQTGLRTFLPGQEALVEAVLKAPRGIEVFTVALKDLVADAGITRAEAAGWRFLALEGNDATAVDVISRDGERPATVAALSRDKLIAVVVDGLNKLPEMDILREKQNARLRILRIPGILTEAFWLRTGSGQEYILPFLVPDAALKVMEVYTLEEFLDAARPIAERFLAADDGDNVDSSAQLF